MLSQVMEEMLAERLVSNIEKTNNFILEKIGQVIKRIGTLSPSQAYQISQILKYGGSYEQIAKELARVSGKSVQEIYNIFDEVAKNNKQFAKEFYRYRGIDYIPYSKDLALQNQVRSIAALTANTYINISNTRGVGFLFKGLDGQMYFKDIRQSYDEIIDRAILAVSQGKETYQTEMRKLMKELGHNGVVMYENGHTRRLDSAIRMNMLDGIRQLNNETSRRFGEEYGADGVEISVHANPAPDHADIQGRQFSIEEYEKLEAGQVAKDYQGRQYDGADKRRISEYNCYHKEFNIVLGVSKPEYTDEQLKKIQKDNEKGFEYEGKHYTMYEGTQLQRRIELEIRKQKDTQIMARAAGNKELAEESQMKINQLTHKYDSLCKTSGLLPKKQRMSVSGYRKIKVNDNTASIQKYIDNLEPLNSIESIAEYINSRKEELYGLDVKANQLKLNERYGYNEKPTLLSYENYDKLKDANDYNNPERNNKDENILVYRGWDNKKYYEQYIYGENSYGEGGFIDGVGTYATDNEWAAHQYSDNNDDLFMEIAIPTSAKFISKENLMEMHFNIYENYNANRDKFLSKYGSKVVDILDTMNENISSTAVLNHYDIIYNGPARNWVILNRGIIKIKNK